MNEFVEHLGFRGIKIKENNVQKILYSVYAAARGHMTPSELLIKCWVRVTENNFEF